MDHVITIGGLLRVLCGIVGVGVGVFGGLMFFAGGMSDAPIEGRRVSTQGCMVIIAGALLLGAGWLF